MPTSFWTDNRAAAQHQLLVNTTGDQQEAAQNHIPGGVTGAVNNDAEIAAAELPDLYLQQTSATTTYNSASTALGAANTTLTNATTTLSNAQTAYVTAEADFQTAESNLQTAQDAYIFAPNSTNLAALNSAIAAWSTADQTFKNADLALQSAQTDYDNAVIDADAAQSVFDAAEIELNAINAEIARLEAVVAAGGTHPLTIYARAVFPHYDGTTNSLPVADRPADFDDAAPATFSTWHSAYQAEWLAARSGIGSVTAVDVSGTDVYYLLSTDGQTVIPVNNLEASEIGKLNQADQQLLVNNTTVWSNLQASLGVSATTTGGGSTVSSIYSEIQAGASVMGDDHLVFLQQMDLLIERNNNSAIVDQDMLDEKAGEILDRFNRALQFASAPDQTNIRMIFYGEENLSLRRLPTVTLQASYNPYSSDNGATVGEGYDEFMRAERAILSTKMAREAIAPVSGGFSDPRLDVPSLIYRLQSLYEIETGAIEDAETEELLQLYALLDDYAIMQAMINETIKAYDVENTGEDRRFMNVDGTNGTSTNNVGDPVDYNNDHVDSISFSYTGSVNQNYASATNTNEFANENWFYSLQADTSNWDAFRTESENQATLHWESHGNLSEEQMRVFSMFASDYFTNAADSPHPIESLYGIDRPLQEMLDEDNGSIGKLARYEKSVWDTYSTQLSDAVTQLNQQVQLKQNDISDATKQANRHFELGNNALTKMYDMIGQIARM